MEYLLDGQAAQQRLQAALPQQHASWNDRFIDGNTFASSNNIHSATCSIVRFTGVI